MDESLLFIALLIAAIFLTIALTHISLLILSATKWKMQAEVYRRHEEITSESKEEQAGHDSRNGAAANFAALIHTIKAEGRANRAEEQREDDASKLREWLTIALIALTLIAVGWQVNEMIKVYGPIKDQADAAKRSAATAEASQRAWVGPISSNLERPPIIGESNIIHVVYQNAGREPAIGISYYMDAFGVGTRNMRDPRITQKIADNLSKCKALAPTSDGQIALPNAVYRMHKSVDQSPVENGLRSWKETMIAVGCISYMTYGKPHRSAFCYFFQAGNTEYQSLSICDGNYAD